MLQREGCDSRKHILCICIADCAVSASLSAILYCWSQLHACSFGKGSAAAADIAGELAALSQLQHSAATRFYRQHITPSAILSIMQSISGVGGPPSAEDERVLFAAAMVHLPTASVLYSVDCRESYSEEADITDSNAFESSSAASARGNGDTTSTRSRASSAADGRSDGSSTAHDAGVPAIKPVPPTTGRHRSASMDGRLSTSRQQAARRNRRSLKAHQASNANAKSQHPASTAQIPRIKEVIRVICTMLQMRLRCGATRYDCILELHWQTTRRCSTDLKLFFAARKPLLDPLIRAK